LKQTDEYVAIPEMSQIEAQLEEFAAVAERLHGFLKWPSWAELIYRL
jgi:hypothetical protein